MNKAEIEYWKKYYDDDKIVGGHDSQKNVGRTVKGIPIPDELWSKTINFISDKVSLDKSCDVIELCCGNGEVIGNLAPKSHKAIGVDYSVKLLAQMKSRFGDLVESVHANVMDVSFDNESFDIVIIYASIQYFDEKETIQLVERSLKWLKSGGRMFIGDVPDELKKWDYVNKPAYRQDYIKRALNDSPMIGVWFQSRFFEALADYFSGISVEIIKQPEYQNNFSYRYDVLITKK